MHQAFHSDRDRGHSDQNRFELLLTHFPEMIRQALTTDELISFVANKNYADFFKVILKNPECRKIISEFPGLIFKMAVNSEDWYEFIFKNQDLLSLMSYRQLKFLNSKYRNSQNTDENIKLPKNYVDLKELLSSLYVIEGRYP